MSSPELPIASHVFSGTDPAGTLTIFDFFQRFSLRPVSIIITSTGAKPVFYRWNGETNTRLQLPAGTERTVSGAAISRILVEHGDGAELQMQLVGEQAL